VLTPRPPSRGWREPDEGFAFPPDFLAALDVVFAAPEVRFDDDEYHQDTLYRCPRCGSFYKHRMLDDRMDRWAPRQYEVLTLESLAGARMFLTLKGRPDLAEGLTD
jgi:hypothetical protein